MEFNLALVKLFITSHSLRKTKTAKADACCLAKYLLSLDYKPHPKQYYHKYSLCQTRDKLVKQRSYYLVQLTNILDITFPEFKPFFDNKFSVSTIFILDKYKSAQKIAKMKDYDAIKKIAYEKFSYPKIIKLKELAKNTIGTFNEIYEFQLSSTFRFNRAC